MGCQLPANEDPPQYDIMDFAFIKKAPEAKGKNDINTVIKVYFNENDGSLDKGFAINIEEELIFVDPWMGSRGIRTSIQEPIDVTGTDDLKEVLKKYNVQSWKSDYTFEGTEMYEDGYSWRLWLQFEDGMVEKHRMILLNTLI